MPKVTIIKPRTSSQQTDKVEPSRKLRVGAYCRVSTRQEEQQQSFAAQVDYYTGLIASRPDWQYSGIYADEGISGTSKSKRLEFVRLMQDCEDKKLDMVLTKSISRFARNTQDCMEAIRRLKSLGIAVYFEKEKINTLQVDSELMLTILGSVAQEEVLSMSRNNRWAVQKKFQSGEWTPSYLPYGYRKDEQGEIVLQEEETEVVRRIFRDYLSGKGAYQIAKQLTADGVPTRRGTPEWSERVIAEMLHNEKYAGDLLMQKTFTTDELPFVRKRNRGQRQQYRITDNHEPLLTSAEAGKILAIMNRRRREKRMLTEPHKYNNRYPFSGRIVCGACGAVFKRQKLYPHKSYASIQWCCTGHLKHRDSCPTTGIREPYIRQAFIRMVNKLNTNRQTILLPLEEGLVKLQGLDSNHPKMDQLNEQLAALMEQSHVLSRLRSIGYVDSVLFMERSRELMQTIADVKEQKSRLLKDSSLSQPISQTRMLNQLLEKQAVLEEFDEQLFQQIVNKIVVNTKRQLTFQLSNGLELAETLGEEEP